MTLKIKDIAEIYDLISSASKDHEERKVCISIRKELISKKEIVKLAFDTRKFNSESDYHPRRGLQNYRRSEAFISTALSNKIQIIQKLKQVLDKIKEEFITYPEYQDSYCRILLNTVDNVLRTNINDNDFSETQQSAGSVNYLEELLFARYRLTLENMSNLSDHDLKQNLLNKDEILKHKEILAPSFKSTADSNLINRATIQANNYNDLLNKLFDVKATAENKNVKRTVSITIEDSIIEE